MKAARGSSLLEIIFVSLLLSIILILLVNSYIVSHDRRVIAGSAVILADTLRSAHLYAQNGREQRSWGVKSAGDRDYHLVSWIPTAGRNTPTTWDVIATNNLRPGVKFADQFFIYFYVDSGDSSGGNVSLEGKNNQEVTITINESGVVEIE